MTFIDELTALVGPAGILTGADVSARQIHVWRQEPIRALAIVRPSSSSSR